MKDVRLPDPTADLDWSGYRGAIHEIFESNANQHPDKPCITETGPPSIQYTYRHINEASNILAHHFVDSGIRRGDVVMIYAHRGVDLVVAVMGVLKAGATFSVIDPAYPPNRQIIYLEVARPRGLVIIERATREAGHLADKVRAFIQDQLQIITEIPGLEMQSSGHVLGGSVSGQDIFQPYLAKKAKSPGVLVGPDSTPTLSFTSGSEGKPKGVRGRHFSLTYYFPWMAKTYTLGPDDRFTMLSGIAHDPIQRDMFTPLFLGAELLVPSIEDIQHERLAEWMREHGATVTHLTPAMGQILVGGASAEFPKLHHAFFVGDLLKKKDCRALQTLAANVRIVNMYGTTETQRSVSYYEIPSRAEQPEYLGKMGDTIPAGKGMLNVQLLVVNREDRSKICGVGERGEIYVRAGGLAEGYLGLPDFTKEKFVTNWFVESQKWVEEDQKQAAIGTREPWREFYEGPRDRLYRTGDLGRYAPDGNVECTGRADDQVKIRGFRVELGDIDTNISEYPLVRENITLLRKDKDGDPILVTWYVPEMRKWQAWLDEQSLKDEDSGRGMTGNLIRFRVLSEALREYLKTKLQSYFIPSIFVPMQRMPLNPNGKIDKPKLLVPDEAQLMAAARQRPRGSDQSLSDREKKVAKIWSSLLRNVSEDMIWSDSHFGDLGGDSLLKQQIPKAVKREFHGKKISMQSVLRNSTLREFSALLDSSSSSRDGSEWTNETQTVVDDYAAHLSRYVSLLPNQFPSHNSQVHENSGISTVFLTGATGFLGAYIIQNLLSRHSPKVRIIAHVRATGASEGLQRILRTCEAYGIWSDSWKDRLECVAGDLESPKLGLSDRNWKSISESADVVIHNGARVHWIDSYTELEASNVLGTLECLKLCAEGRAKTFSFVSSTSVLDTDHYVQKSRKLVKSGGKGILESDDLEGSRTQLGTGYGQTKWVSERLVMEAGKRGLKCSIVRPGYVFGDSVSGGESILPHRIFWCLNTDSSQ
jgi:L-aminoadipate-semialdehyde dehydrogenase